jgi:D-proline reductase (dithiol) PrdB
MMAPIDYIPIMRAYYRSKGLGEYPIYQPLGHPWSLPRRPLRECRVALVCSAGISRRDQPPFENRAQDDLSVREIDVATLAEELVINYDYFDHADADADINCLLPLSRLRELATEGFIGSVAPLAYTMGIGRWQDQATPERLQHEVAMDLARRCHAQGADAVLMVPG